MTCRKRLKAPKTLFGKALFRLGGELGLNLWCAYHKMRKHPWMSPAELKKYQDERLRSIVYHAYKTVPYYTKLFDDAGINPADIKSEKDLEKIPITTKKDLQKLSFEEKVSSAFERRDVMEFQTGGSMGIPLRIYVAKRDLARRVAEGKRIEYLNGCTAFDVLAYMQWNPHEKILANHLGLLRELSFLADLDIPDQVKILEREKPEIIESYPSRLNLIAEHILDNRIKMYKPKLIMTNSETLFPHVRKKIEKAFAVKVTNVYDCWEYGRVAWECKEHNGLHVSADSVIVQLVDKGKVGKKGKIIATDLQNYAMPLIRYEMGDSAEWSDKKCPCGIKFPMFKQVLGRQGDSLKLPGGKRMASQDVGYLIRGYPVLEYQIIQKSLTLMHVNLVVKKTYQKGMDEKMMSELKKQTGIRKVVVKHIKSIPRTGAGKLRSFISEI